MGLYRLFSQNVEVQYKSYFLSKAMLFTLITTVLTVILPFVIAFKSRGFWLRSHYFYEQPIVSFTYQYLLVAETDDPSQYLVCGDADGLYGEIDDEESCAEMQVQEYDVNEDGKNDLVDLTFILNVPWNKPIATLTVILSLDFQLKTVCPFVMQSLAVINRDIVVPPSGLKFYGDLQFYQVSHLPCKSNYIDTRYNISVFNFTKTSQDNVVDFILEHYYIRDVTTRTKPIYSRAQSGLTGTMQVQIRLRIPEMRIRYIPSIMQELKWAWPQYLSFVVIFYWMFNKIKRFVFNHRLLMAWEIKPWKKND